MCITKTIIVVGIRISFEIDDSSLRRIVTQTTSLSKASFHSRRYLNVDTVLTKRMYSVVDLR